MHNTKYYRTKTHLDVNKIDIKKIEFLESLDEIKKLKCHEFILFYNLFI